MTIKEAEAELGITRANIRFYEKEGLIFPKRNPINDYRDYSPEDIEILKRVLYLRSLDISVETIRQLKENKLDMKCVLEKQTQEFEHQKKRAEEAKLSCERLLEEEEIGFWNFKMPEVVTMENPKKLKDALNELWMFWDKLVVWGFLALQVLYTLAVLPMLPEQIPTNWQRTVAVDYAGRGFIFMYLAVSIIFMYAVRVILYSGVVGVARCYLDEINAVATVGAIGYGFSMQIYTVLYLKGLRMDVDVYLLICAGLYLASVLLIVFIYHTIKRKGVTVS